MFRIITHLRSQPDAPAVPHRFGIGSSAALPRVGIRPAGPVSERGCAGIVRDRNPDASPQHDGFRTAEPSHAASDGKRAAPSRIAPPAGVSAAGSDEGHPPEFHDRRNRNLRRGRSGKSGNGFVSSVRLTTKPVRTTGLAINLQIRSPYTKPDEHEPQSAILEIFPDRHRSGTGRYRIRRNHPLSRRHSRCVHHLYSGPQTDAVPDRKQKNETRTGRPARTRRVHPLFSRWSYG